MTAFIYVMYYFGIAFATMITLTKFDWFWEVFGDENNSISCNIFYGFIWPIYWIFWIVFLVLEGLNKLLVKIKNTK